MSRKVGNKSRRRLMGGGEEHDIMGSVANLFDVAMVFAVALMVALVSRYNMTEMFSTQDLTKKGEKIQRYTPSNDQSKGEGSRGKKVGVAYQLENGEVIYVPE